MTLEEDVTIIISLKDIFTNIRQVLDFILTNIPPKLQVIYVTTTNEFELQLVKEYANKYSNLSIVESNLHFPCPFELRNLAISHVTTKYIYFTYNDVIPVKENWLVELYQTAETIPTGKVFTPFIWETKDNQSQFHAGWCDLHFIERNDVYYTIHPFDNKLKQEGLQYFKNNFESVLQPYHIEDHAFLARTDFMTEESIMDPQACYTKEFIDMILNMRYRKAETWLVPTSEVSYILSYGSKLEQNDILYFVYRRSEELAYQTMNYIKNKWGMEYSYDGICRDFINEGLANLKWNESQLPCDRFKQFELVLGMLTAMGFNRFDDMKLPQFYLQCEDTISNINWPLKTHRVIIENDINIGQHIDRRQQLREGKLAPVAHSQAFTRNETPITLFYQPFTIIKVKFESESQIPNHYFHLASLIIQNNEGLIDLYLYFLKSDNLTLVYSDNKLFGTPCQSFTIEKYNENDVLHFSMNRLILWAWNPLRV